MKNRWIITFSLVALSSVLLSALAVWRYGLFGSSSLDKGRAPQPSMTHFEKHAAENEVPGEKRIVHLTEAELEEFDIELATAGPEKSHTQISLSGEVVVNADRLAHIGPRVPGIAQEVRSNLGDQVRAGEVMAVITSRELADAKANYLAATQRVALYRANFNWEKVLWRKKISAEQECLDAKQALVEASIEQRATEQKLHALGFSEQYLNDLPAQPDMLLTRYEITAPIDGTVVEKHITLGEQLGDETNAFTIADLSNVCVNLTVYQKDLAAVHVGQEVLIRLDPAGAEAPGTIDYISPFVEKSTRTATARVVLDNPHGRWRPGMFVTGVVKVSDVEFLVAVARSSLQTLEGQTVIFVQTEKGFEPRPVQTGKADPVFVEIVSGLDPGRRYVRTNSFILKAELEKDAFGQGHAH